MCGAGGRPDAAATTKIYGYSEMTKYMIAAGGRTNAEYPFGAPKFNNGQEARDFADKQKYHKKLYIVTVYNDYKPRHVLP